MTLTAYQKAPTYVRDLWQTLLDKDDRNSPAEYPEMCLITFEEFERYLADAVTAEVKIDQEAAEATYKMCRRDERERMAQMLSQMMERAKDVRERAAYVFAANAIRRGRLLTPAEEMENLKAGINDQPAPHPAPTIAQ